VSGARRVPEGQAGMRPSRWIRVAGWRGAAVGVCLHGLLCGAISAPASQPPAAKANASRQTAGADELPRLRAAHRAQPDDPQKALELGLFLFRRDKASLEAQGLLDLASRRLPHRHDVHLKLIESYLRRKNAPAVTALLARLTPELDSSERFAFDATYCLLQHRQFPLAQAQWQRINARVQKQAPPGSQQAPPEVVEALFVQGLLATVAGQKEEALQLFRRAESQGFPPLDSPQVFLLADSFYWLEEFRLAAGTYGEAVQRFPGNVQARLRLGASLYWTSQLAQAKEELDRVLRENPRQLEANLYLGLVLFAMKRSDEARACFERELALDPSCGACMSKLAHLAYMAGDDRRAESWLEKAVALGSASPETDLIYGMIANRAGKYDVAIRYLSRAVEQVPQSAQAQFQLATAHQRRGNAERAQEHFALYRQLTAAENAPPSEGAK
jgi:tetratricopeptide (TPR) repeat protein